MAESRIDHDDEMLEYAEKIIDEHWRFIERALLLHGVDEQEVERIGFWYKSAGLHFWEHGVEWMDNQTWDLDFSVDHSGRFNESLGFNDPYKKNEFLAALDRYDNLKKSR